MGDRQIKSQIEAAIASVPALAGTKVGTEVFDGRVILVGDVATSVQEREALAAAFGVPGVKEVLSALRVAELQPVKPEVIDDATLKSMVEAALIDHGLVIHGEGVSVTHGEVTLKGQVKTARQKIQAERLVTTVKGVQGVRSELGVRGRGSGIGSRRPARKGV